MGIKTRSELERLIVRKVVSAAVKEGYTFVIDNGGDSDENVKTEGVEPTLNEMLQTDQEKLIFVKDGKRVGWVYFVYGNDGWDVINNYTVNLNKILDPVLDYAESLSV